MTKNTTMYKIMNKEGKFSSGGENPTFTRNGKIWSNIGFVKNHINQLYDANVYDNCQIVEIETISKEVPNKLDQLIELSLVKDLHKNPKLWTDREKKVFKRLGTKFVYYGTCQTELLKEIITSSTINDNISSVIPIHMIENFDEFHNIGIKNCTPTQLAAIILTATKEQIQMYNL